MKVRVIQNGTVCLVSYFYDNTSCIICSPTDYTVLKFSDEFNVDGAPDATKWSYDLGAGGWGNSESQSYTSAADNVVGGNLKITAKKSRIFILRLKSENKLNLHTERLRLEQS
jgi:hypothetical protein